MKTRQRMISAQLLMVALVFAAMLPEHVAAQTRRRPAQSTPQRPKTNLPTQAERVEVEVAPVSDQLTDAAVKAALRIDSIVELNLKQKGITPNEPSTDEHFVRRIYLDTIGTIPTATEAQAFLRSGSRSKRTALIDRLLGHPGYASHMYNWLADILRLVDRPNNNTLLTPYNDWVKSCLRDNRPWDDMVNEMLSAEGKVWEHPAVGFVLRDDGMPLDNLDNAVRTFLGTRIGCAQCHDHPFDRWTQREFYELAALVGGTQFRVDRARGMKLNDNMLEGLAGGRESREFREARNILRYNRSGILNNEKVSLKYPHDYAYDDARPGDTVVPKVPFGTIPSKVAPEDRRKVFADWVTGEDNPRFAITIVNRLWKKAMGHGLIEPVDDLRDDTEAPIPQLMEFLVGELKRVNYDIKEFQRILYYTRTYQRQVTYDDLDPATHYLFPGPVLRRMTAEQVWDSLLTLTIREPDAVIRQGAQAEYDIIDITADNSAQDVVNKAKELMTYRDDQNKERRKRLYKGIELMRASELPQPLPEGHFVRQFGQSSRDIISDSHTDGTVPQLLTMFNGPVTHMMLEEGSVIYNDVMAERNTEGRIEVIFLCLLSRYPTEREVTHAEREIDAQKNAGYGNVIWALLNTREFLFIQ